MTATETANDALAGFAHLDIITVEFGDSKGRNFMFKPTSEVYRGRFSKSYLPHGCVSDELAYLPDVPGLVCTLDLRRGVAKIVDPLGMPKNATAWDRLRRHLKEQLRLQNPGPEPTRTFELRTPTQAKTWLYWLAVMLKGPPLVYDQDGQPVDGGPQLRLISGHLPTTDEILKLPGKVTICQQDSASNRRRRYLENELARLASDSDSDAA